MTKSRELSVPPVVGACTFLAAFVAFKILSSNQNKRTHIEPHFSHEIKLLSVENVLAIMGEPPTSTATWFLGNCEERIESLKARMELLIEKNPWLAGRLIKRKGELFLAYNDHISREEGPKLRHLMNSQVSKDDTMEDMARSCQASHGNERNDFLFKVAVIPCSASPTEYYAVVVSLSHVVADGHTYYSILNMLLDPSVPVVALVTDRLHNTDDLQADAMGGRDKSQFARTAAFIVTVILGTIHSMIPSRLMGPKQYQRFVQVDNEKIKKLKKKLSGEDSFVSTNDILTSWFFRIVRPTVGLMAINFRGRLESHSELHAGNYQNCIPYLEEDYSTPSLIRRSVQDTKRTGLGPMPTLFQMMQNPLIPVIANWTTFKRAYPDEFLHLPLVVDKPLPTTLPMAVVFQPSKGDTGLFVVGYGRAGRRLMEKADFEKC